MSRATCRRLTSSEEVEQHRLYMAATTAPGGPPVDVGGLLYCRVHRCPLIECHDDKQDCSSTAAGTLDGTAE
jgi:hypothetical protein